MHYVYCKCNIYVFSLKTTYIHTKFKLLQVFEKHTRFILDNINISMYIYMIIFIFNTYILQYLV